MAHLVTVEGTGTPCAGVLAPGVRSTVAVTAELRALVRRGCVRVVEGSLNPPTEPPVVVAVADPEPVPAPDDFEATSTGEVEWAGPDTYPFPPVDLTPPPRNASRDDWVAFLDPHGFDTDGKGRDQLITEWDDYLAERASDGEG